MTPYAIAAVEASFLTGLSVLGLLVGGLIKPRMDFPLLIAVSYAVGTAICLLTSLLIIILPPPFQATFLFATLGLIFTALLAVNWSLKRFSTKETTIALIYNLVFFMLARQLCFHNFMVASDDSLWMMRLGEILAHTGNLDPTMTMLGKWSIAIPVFQAIAAFLHIGSFTGLFPLLLVPLLFGFSRGSWLVITGLNSSNKLALPVAITGGLFLGSEIFIQWNAFYINAHLASGLYLLLFITIFSLAALRRESGWLFFSSLFLLMFCLWRVESIIFATVYLFLLLPAINVPPLKKLFAGILVLLPVATWYLHLYQLYAPAKSFLNGRMIVMLTAMALVLLLITIARRFSAINMLLTYGPHLLILAITIILFIFVLSKPEHMAIALNNILGNIFQGQGMWGMGWIMVFPLLIISQGLASSFPLDRRLLASFVFFALFLLAISFFRTGEGYRLSHWDSANRILVHIFPCCVYYLALKFSGASYFVSEGKKLS
jgi:hypothetical protein